jgi:ABC-type phosphate/phosphonate transport system permease subunit
MAMVMGDMGMIGIGVKTSPPLRPGPTYTGSYETEDVATVIVVVMTVSVVVDGPS